jgi:hypothetical protein
MSDERLAEIRRRNEYLRNIPFDTHGPGIHGDNCPPCGMVRGIGDVTALLEQLEQQRAIIARVTDQMRQYDRHGGFRGMVNVRQVLNLLSPTWPDGNYEAAQQPEDGDRG